MAKLKSTSISGVYEIVPFVSEDYRGKFVKTYHENDFYQLGLATKYAEEYYSVSNRDVIRGLHFQVPPDDHEKLVYCVSGNVFDVIVDIRVGSPTYGKAEVFQLDSKKANGVYLPKGVAHGFCATSSSATLLYKVTTCYSQKNDCGILWSSVDVDWPVKNPIISERDKAFVSLKNFVSPFQFC